MVSIQSNLGNSEIEFLTHAIRVFFIHLQPIKTRMDVWCYCDYVYLW